MTEVDSRLPPSLPMPHARPGRIPPRSPGGPPMRPPLPGRRQSNESSATRPRPGVVGPGKTRTPPPLPQRNGSPSVFSGREGSIYTRRADTMTSPPPAELELFAHHCRVFYLFQEGEAESGDYISRTLARLPPAHRAAYTRVQSQLRAQAHLHHLRVRISSFHALIAANAPNSGLSGLARSDLGGPRARAERVDRLAFFLRKWGGSAGALEPFFRGLWSVFRLQSRGDSSRGGGGPRCVVWEIDDAVFLESGGPEFMHEALVVMKGVLGFEEQSLSDPPKLRRIPTTEARTPPGSDPFTDNSPPLMQQMRKTSGRGPAPPPPPSRRRPTNTSLTPTGSEDPTIPLLAASSNPTTPVSPVLLPPSSPSPVPSEDDEECDAEEEADLNKARFRIWTFPTHITDEEAENLMSLFPRYLQRPDARFPLPRHRLKDLELGSGPWHTIVVEGVQVSLPKVESEDEAGVVRAGTGRVWVGNDERLEGWVGGMWFRFKRWWRRLFGRG